MRRPDGRIGRPRFGRALYLAVRRSHGLDSARYGIVGGGFITGFQLRALAAVRGIEVAGLVSRRPPDSASPSSSVLKGWARGERLASIREMKLRTST